MVYPPREVIDSFNDIYFEIMNQYSHIQNENEKLSEIRDSLLPRLMSGELTC